MLITAAWVGARLARVKKFPNLDKTLGKPAAARGRRRGKARTWQQQLSAWEGYLRRKG